MQTATATQLVDGLRQHRLLSPAQLDEVTRELQRRYPDSKALAAALVERGWLTSYQAKQLLQGRGADLVLGSYVLLDRLGEGGTGQVFKARHLAMNRIVALKLLRKEVLADKEVIGRFYREIEVASQISHPNVVHAYDAGPIGAVLALAMEYVEGTDLDRLVKDKGPLNVAQACEYIKQAAEGLQYAHERGLIHRDIKPSNLLVKTTSGSGSSSGSDIRDRPWGLVKILDLGLARLQQPAAASTTKNLTMLGGSAVMQGTPDYMAPEQALDFHSAGTRADIYGLGCTFYFLLAGQPPFPTGNLAEKLMMHQTAEPRPIRELRKDVPPAVAAVLHRMLAKKLQDRYAQAGEIVAALSPHARVSKLLRTLSGENDSTVTEMPPPGRKVTYRQPVPVASRIWWLIPLIATGVLGFLGLIILVVYLVLAGSDKSGTLLASRSPTGTDKSSKAPKIAAPPGSGPVSRAPATNKSDADPSLLGHWRLDETTGTSASDASGKGNPATLRGAVWAPGKFGGAVSLNGQDAYIDYGPSPRFQFADQAGFTFAGWVKTTAPYGAIVSQRSSTNDKPVIDVMVGKDGGTDEPGRLMALVRDDNHGDQLARVTGGLVNDGQWHHFALVRSGSTITLYLDGTAQGSNTNAGAGGPITTDLQAFGSERRWVRENFAKTGQCFLQGWLDDMRIYNRPLTAAEIAALAKASSN